jgi:CRISPR-associated DxTHG motif protein
MKVLSFLGTGDYYPVTYLWREAGQKKEFQTHLFPEAVVRIFGAEKLVLFVTQAAQARYGAAVQERLGHLVEFVPIPEGKSEPELWSIFDRCAESVKEGDEIILDVTHAFRSLPLYVFVIAAYLRRTKSVVVRRIIYGAYDAREPLRTPPDPADCAPIFDLTPLLDLLDWLSGAEAFLQRGDATLLARRLDQAHRRLWVNRETEDLPKSLQIVARKLALLSLAVQVVRPLEIMRYAHELLPLLDQAAAEVGRWAKPFAVILHQVREEAERLAHGEPFRLDSTHLRKQLGMIDYFLQRGLVAQAILLAREWLVSWVACWRGQGDWLNVSLRENEIKSALGAAEKRAQNQARSSSRLA